MNNDQNRNRIGDRVTIYPRGKKKTFCADFWLEGQHRRKSLHTRDRKIAEQRAVKLAASLQGGTYEPPPPPVTVQVAVEDYLSYLTTEGRRPKTLVRYRGELCAFRDFLQSHGVIRLAQITPVLFDKFRQARVGDHSLRTLYHEGVVIKQFQSGARAASSSPKTRLPKSSWSNPRAIPSGRSRWHKLKRS